MSIPVYAGRENYFKVLNRSTLKNIQSIIQCTDFKTVKIIVEILLNILKGIVPVSAEGLSQLKAFKPIVNRLISTMSSMVKKRQIFSSESDIVKFAARALI